GTIGGAPVSAVSGLVTSLPGRNISGAFMDEHRTTPRHRVLKAGTIEFSGEAIPCTVRNLSDTGAAIEINSPLWFPDRFVLAVASEGWRKPCRVVRRQDKRIGIVFE